MTGRREQPVANPDRTHVDDGDELQRQQDNKHADPHDQPWSAVAKEVKKAVEDADGPLT
jgi:hypothetical protein